MADLTRERIKALLWGDVAWSSEDVDALCAMALRALDTVWQPMSTAPRDGTRVLVACVGLYRQGTEAAHWDSELASWETDDDRTIHPDAWMPLPPPFTGASQTKAPEPGECADCNGTGKRKGGAHG